MTALLVSAIEAAPSSVERKTALFRFDIHGPDLDSSNPRASRIDVHLALPLQIAAAMVGRLLWEAEQCDVAERFHELAHEAFLECDPSPQSTT